jgi:hypothetical protein
MIVETSGRNAAEAVHKSPKEKLGSLQKMLEMVLEV